MANVKIGKTVSYETLENALKKAAKDMGWNIKVEDDFNLVYKLGSITEEKEYDHTDFTLKGKIFSKMIVTVFDKEDRNSFAVVQPHSIGAANQEKVKKYLSSVSSHL